MSGSVLKSALAEVWYLVIILLVISLVVVYKLAVGGEAAPAEQKAGAAASQSLAAPVGAAAAVRAPRLSEQDKAKATIADYQKRFAEDARGKDAPAFLFAIGNLSKQKLRDFKEAARNYELLIKDYPAWEGIAAVYPQLMSCYELLNDQQGLRWLYNEMMDKFPPESNEYKYAQVKLNS